MKLTLLRHGDTAGSRDDLYYGAADIPVLPDSLEMLAERAKTGVYPTAARYYTSGLVRTEQTLRALYGDVAHTQLPGLREMDFGDFEMKSYAELKDDPAFQAWCENAEHNACPMGKARHRCWRGIWRPSSRCWTRERTRYASFTAASPLGC